MALTNPYKVEDVTYDPTGSAITFVFAVGGAAGVSRVANIAAGATALGAV